MKITGVTRDASFSPNSNDWAIMEAVGKHLGDNGHQVDFISEKDILEGVGDTDAIFSMARSSQALETLALCEKQGIPVINSTQGVLRCNRTIVTRLMIQAGLLVPPSQCFTVHDAPEVPSIAFPLWVKRADQCAQVKEDVCFLSEKSQWASTLKDFQHRQVESIVLSQHLEGDIVKFYGVAPTGFFYWYYPTLAKEGHSKFGLEAVNGPARQYPFNAPSLHTAIEEFAFRTGTWVYGGDCIIDNKGNYHIIDFNDWPSFSPCREPASIAIASLFEHLHEHFSRWQDMNNNGRPILHPDPSHSTEP